MKKTAIFLLLFCLAGSLIAYENDDDILEHAEEILGISKIEKIYHDEETDLRICREGKTDLKTIRQERVVPVTPPIIGRPDSICNGHEESSEKGRWMLQRDKVKEWKKHIRKNRKPFLEGPTFEIKREAGWAHDEYKLVAKYRHKNNCGDKCDNYHEVPNITPAKIAGPDEFVYDSPGTLDKLQKDPRCHLISSKVVDEPSTRNIHGLEITRDFWSKNLVYSCNDSSYSDCGPLIEQGGIFVSKSCEQENPMGGCDVWKKTYDLGKNKAWVEEIYHFEDEDKKIYGLNGEFDHYFNHEKKESDLPEVLSMMSLFTNMHQEGVQRTSTGELTNLYAGAPFSCRCIGSEVDCCYRSSDGDQIEEQMKECKQEEKELAVMREEQRCIYVDTKRDPIDQTTEHRYCCFTSMPSRLAQEQIREKDSWLLNGELQCRGLTSEEIESAGGLNNLNLTEAKEDFAPAGQQINDAFQKTIMQQLKDAFEGRNYVE